MRVVRAMRVANRWAWSKEGGAASDGNRSWVSCAGPAKGGANIVTGTGTPGDPNESCWTFAFRFAIGSCENVWVRTPSAYATAPGLAGSDCAADEGATEVVSMGLSANAAPTLPYASITLARNAFSALVR
jgi:hypothetical protein